MNVSVPSALALVQIERERRRRVSPAPRGSTWSPVRYVNRDTGREYAPHHEAEAQFVRDDDPRYALAKGGEGGGKSVAGIVKALERLRRGMDGIVASPDFEHFKKSLWEEFARWCPWREVVEREQYRAARDWTPSQPFILHFRNGAKAYCGGMEDPTSWEGPNLSFGLLDEARRKRDASALKVMDGRARITGPSGEPPQLFFTTTPRKHWLYDYFGGVEGRALVDVQADDPLIAFKRQALVVSLFTADNAANLSEGYVEQRRLSLTEAEARVLLEAAWEDIDDVDRFLPSMTLWDGCIAPLPPLGEREPLVLAADAGVTNDNFGLVGVTRHPELPDEGVAVRYIRKWDPKGKPLDFDVIEAEIANLCKRYNVVCLTYDPYQLHQMSGHLKKSGVVWVKDFNQGGDRLKADKQLYDLITARRIAHDGNADLRAHIDNADRKVDAQSRQVRIVKRSATGKVDLAVALSMAAAVCLELNL